jgi:hypothetical protein
MEGLGRTGDAADHLVFVLKFTVHLQELALKTELVEAELPIQSDCGGVPRVDPRGVEKFQTQFITD